MEAHLLDFDANLRGRRLRLDFVARLRDEVKFKSVNDLTEQINRDIALARTRLATADE